METWRRASDGKSPMLCDEIGSTADAPARTENISMGWDMKTSCNFDNMVVSSREAIDSMELIELGFPEKPNPSNPSLDLLVGEVGNNFRETLPSPAFGITSNSSFGKLESGLSLSSPVIESNSQKTTLTDLKVETDWRQAKNSRFSNKRTVLSSVGSSLTSKKGRIANLYSQDPICQVYNCNKDLSSSKEYLKKHKVCDVHSKTAKVVVNGTEQRFCQQCSRFHVLAEFDDGKRSCRKRLACHNERRRKPQLDILSGKPQKLLQYYQGARSLRASLACVVFPDTLPGWFFSPQGNDLGNQVSHIKVEEGPIHGPRLPMLSTNRQFLSKPAFHLHGMGKQYSSENFSSLTGYSSLDTASMVQELSGVSNSGSAPSLLSAQSNILSSHWTGIHMASPPIIPSANAHCCVDQNSENFESVSVEEKFSPNGFCSGMKSREVFDAGSAINFEVEAGGFFRRLDSMKSESYLSPEYMPTVDLIHLSSHLQRVEQPRNSMQVKPKNDVFCSFPTM